MNDWNWLENQMRGWTPRRPSAGVKARLVSNLAVEPTHFWLSGRGWLTPAAVSLALVLLSAAAHFRSPAAAPTTFPVQIVAATLSNHSSIACYLEPANIGFNAPILGMPKPNRISSALGGFPLLRTNSTLY